MSLPVFRVFVSSTWRDLRPEREAVRDAVLRMRETQFVGMEYFGSRDETTRDASLEEVERSRLYVGIIAARYGSGITEDEYRRARRNGLPCLIYFKDDANVPDELRETDPAQAARLDALKAELMREHVVSTFDSPADLAAKVSADLHRWLFDKYLPASLQRALRGELPRDEAQALLDAVQDLRSLKQDLLDSLHGAGLTVTRALYQLRAPVGDFVGREKEVDELLATLRRGGSAAISGVSGMGGIGKTELSFYVAERLRDTYPDAQLVLDMRGTDDPPRDPSDALASCIRAFLGLEYKPPDDLDDLTRLYRSTLEGKRALILLDNARDGAQVRPLLPPPGSALLITSRNAIALAGMKTRITLDQLTPDEARELLTGITPRVAADVADQICHLCGYLPLAIRAAASLLDVTADLTAETYAAQLRDERTRLELIGEEGVDVSVEASFNLSYARLSPDAARVFRQLALFPATFDARAEEAVCEDENHKHLTDLLRRNLVLYNPDTRRYRLHDLARLFADSRLSEEERDAGYMRYAGKYLKVLEECNALYMKGGEAIKSGLALFDAERRNIEAGQAWASKHADRDEAVAQLCNEYPNAGLYVLSLRQRPRDSIRWHEAALAAARKLKTRIVERAHMLNLGAAYASLGEYRRAIELYDECLIIYREIGYRAGEAKVLGNLGNAYAQMGETRRAIKLHEQALTISREVGDRQGESQDLGGLGYAYDSLGEYRRAIEFYEQRLAICRELGDRRGEAAMLCNMGVSYSHLNEMRRAADSFEQALAVARDIGDRRTEAASLLNVGVILVELGDRAKAIAHAETALEIFEQLESPGAENARTALALWGGKATEGE